MMAQARNKRTLTAERLREVLRYEPSTGIFTWRVKIANRAPAAGSRAGHLRKTGYVAIAIDGALLLAHRLAWFYMHGQWPTKTIDHVNLVRSDNRWENLREATASQQRANSLRMSNNRCGYKGVVLEHRNPSWRPRWHAHIAVDHKQINLGRFDSPDDAHAAYEEAAIKYFGAYART